MEVERGAPAPAPSRPSSRRRHPQDVLRSSAHALKLAERDRLLASLAALNAEGAANGVNRRRQEEPRGEMQVIERQRMEMQKTADLHHDA